MFQRPRFDLSQMVVSVLVLLLVQQCSLFQKKDSDLVKPKPLGGYEALSTRIHYPKSIRQAGIEGTVAVNCMVSLNGEVTETEIVNSVHPELDRIALKAITSTQFEPATRNGKPVAVWISIPIVFALNDWKPAQTPFSHFEMLVQPEPSYNKFAVQINARLKPGFTKPVRIECLLPFNADKSWVRTGAEAAPLTGTVEDESGEWLIFEVDANEISWGFDYVQLPGLPDRKLSYDLALNHPLPSWTLIINHRGAKVNFSQPADREVQEGAFTRYEYDLSSMEAMEVRHLDIELWKD